MQKIKHNGEAHNNNLTTHGVYCSNGKRYLLYKRKDADTTWKQKTFFFGTKSTGRV